MKIGLKHAIMFHEEALRDRKASQIIDLKQNRYPWRDDLIMDAARRDIEAIERILRVTKRQLDEVRMLLEPGREELKKKDHITQDMIAHARDYPLSNIVEVNRGGWAKCVWHNETHASMYCKKNFAHCFSCQKTGDVIAVFMHLRGVGFKEAVLSLQ